MSEVVLVVLISMNVCPQEVAEPLSDMKQGLEDLRKNRTLKYILAILLSIGNFLNNSDVSIQSNKTHFSNSIIHLLPSLIENLYI